MIPYIKSTRKENTIECNADFVVTHNSQLVALSLLDISGKVKKVFADIIQGDNQLVLYDREDFIFEEDLRAYNYYGEASSYKYKLSKHNNKITHGIIFKSNEPNYIYDWKGMGMIDSLTLHLRNNHYLPVTKDIVQKVIDKLENDTIIDSSSLIEECEVHTNKEDMQHVNVWYLKSVQLFKELLEDIVIDTNNTDTFDWSEINDINDYLIKFVDPIKNKLKENINILYDKDKVNPKMFEKMKPFDGQVPIIQGGIETLKKKENRFLYLASAPGVGKTYMSTRVNHLYQCELNKDAYCTLVVAPTATLTQWQKELKRIINEDVDVILIRNTDQFIRLYEKTKLKINKPTYILVGKETFKLSYKTTHGINVVKRNIEVEVEKAFWTDTEIQTIEVCTCPDCGKPLKNPLRKSKTVYLQEKDFKTPKKSNYKCSECDSVLWQATYVKNRKTSIIDYVKRRNIRFDSVIIDEIHESNNFDTIIGAATREIMKRGKKIILLSGTVTNGYASSIYNILFALIPNKLKRDGVFKKEDFIKTYGTLKAVTKNKDNRYYVTSRTQLKESDYQEVEGINPLVFTKYFANNFIFTELSEIRSDLPDLNEYFIEINHLQEVINGEKDLREDIEKTSPFNASFYNESVIKHYTNKPFGWNEIPFKKNEEGIEQVDYVYPLNTKNILLPKEKEALEICKKEKSENRKVWIYCDFVTNGRYTEGEALNDRLKRILEENGLSVYVLKSSTRTIERKEVIEKNKDKYDVFISSAKLVGTGLNMQWCPNYIFYSPTYHVNTVRQAMLRGMRADSTEYNNIYHLAYNDGIEKEILERFKLKRAESEAAQAKFSDLDVERTASSLGAKIEKELTGIV